MLVIAMGLLAFGPTAAQDSTRINAGTLNNLGTGRLYGDTLSIAAATLNNDAETLGGITSAATIDARQQLDMGAASVNTRNGALDARRKATGSAHAVINAGGSIESLGAMKLAAAYINNTNPAFAYDVLYSTGAGGKDFITSAGTLGNRILASQ